MKGPDNSVVDGDWAPGLLKARIYEQMLLDIILGHLPPMSVLDERALTVRYAAGLAGVREALGRLALEGMVVRRPRVGTVVAPLEARTAGLAARNATAEDIDAISTAFDGAETAIAQADFRAMLAMDRAFHRAVAQATHNPTLARFVVSLQNVATRFWIWAMEKQSPEAQLEDVRLHRDLAAAIAARDIAGAEAAAERLVGEPPSRSGT
jgi:DNA-binding GntR family transcriptional regulator